MSRADISSTEELRKMLRSADRARDPVTPSSARQTIAASHDQDLKELASLIGSLDIDLTKTVTKERPRGQTSGTGAGSETESNYSGRNGRWNAADVSFADDESLQSSQLEFTPMKSQTAPNDREDYGVIRFGQRYILRGKLGRYLTAVPEDVVVNAAEPSKSTQYSGRAPPVSKVYHLGLEGQGVGDPLDCICFTNIDNKDDDGPVKYGMTVAIRAPSAKERYLGLKEGSRLGFWRNLIGQGEKWQVLKASGSTGVGASAFNGATSVASSVLGASTAGAAVGRGCEEISARGAFVRLGDAILLQTYKSDHLLSLHETLHGSEAKLVFRDRAMLGCEVWQLEQFNSVGLPSWYHSRPYLNGQYLVMPNCLKAPAMDIQARTFPHATLMLQQEQSAARNLGGIAPLNLNGGASVAPPLNTLPALTQQVLLMRDLLSVLVGVEGQYIRVAAAGAGGVEAGVMAGLGESGVTRSGDLLRKGSDGALAAALRAGGAPAMTLPKVAEAHFVIDLDTADRSVASQVAQLLPVCESAVRVREFVKLHSRFEYGMVSHALCAALKKILREFDILVAQLEVTFAAGKLSLQKMVYLLQPSRATLHLLERLCARLRDTVGGRMLDTLHSVLLEQGDVKARELHLHLLTKAFEPFLDTLSTWIFRGVLQDPYGEFMVVEDRSQTKETLEEDFNARYWDNRFTLNEKHIPTILRGYALKALTAGKYLSVVLDCAGESGAATTNRGNGDADFAHQQLTRAIESADSASGGRHGANGGASGLILPSVRKLQLSLEVADSPLSQAIQEAYVLSSRALLKILDARGLRSHMISLRRFFLLEHGDFFTQFMDAAEDELCREVKEVHLPRVQGLLQMAVQTSTLVNDPHKEDLSCTLASHNLIQHLQLIQSAGEANADAYASLSSQGLKGVEAFTLDYKVGWPNSIVLSRRAITKYQLLSRLLYFSKHVERRVLNSWMGHQSTKELNVRGAMGPAYCLRHRMLHFLQNFVYYVTLEVIGPRGHELETWLDKAEDLDEVMELHEKFLDTCLKECLLASQDLLKILTKIMTTCLLFADQMQRFSLENSTGAAVSTAGGGGSSRVRTSLRNSAELTASLHQRQHRLKESAEFIQKESTQESFVRILGKFGEAFDSQLKEFLDKLWTNNYRHHVQLSNLCVRLDYNGFYSSQFAENF